jgi:hypothetical protein
MAAAPYVERDNVSFVSSPGISRRIDRKGQPNFQRVRFFAAAKTRSAEFPGFPASWELFKWFLKNTVQI